MYDAINQCQWITDLRHWSCVDAMWHLSTRAGESESPTLDLHSLKTMKIKKSSLHMALHMQSQFILGIAPSSVYNCMQIIIYWK